MRNSTSVSFQGCFQGGSVVSQSANTKLFENVHRVSVASSCGNSLRVAQAQARRYYLVHGDINIQIHIRSMTCDSPRDILPSPGDVLHRRRMRIDPHLQVGSQDLCENTVILKTWKPANLSHNESRQRVASRS